MSRLNYGWLLVQNLSSKMKVNKAHTRNRNDIGSGFHMLVRKPKSWITISNDALINTDFGPRPCWRFWFGRSESELWDFIFLIRALKWVWSTCWFDKREVLRSEKGLRARLRSKERNHSTFGLQSIWVTEFLIKNHDWVTWNWHGGDI